MTKLEDAARYLNFHFVKEDKMAYGTYKNIAMTLTSTENNGTVFLEINVDTNANNHRADINDALIQIQKTNKSANNLTTNSYSIHGHFSVFNKKLLEHMKNALDQICELIQTYSLQPCCSSCGGEHQDDLYIWGDNATMLCNSCAAEIGSNITNSDLKNNSKKGNIIMGIVGAFFGALLGGVIWLIAAQFGYIVGLAGYVAVYCAYFGYTKLAGKKDVLGAVVAVIMAIIIIFLAHYSSYFILLYNELGSDSGVTFLYIINLTHELLAVPEVFTEFLLNLGIGYLFLSFGAVPFIRDATKNPTGQPPFHKVASI